MNELQKLAIFKKKGDKGVYYAVYNVTKINDSKKHYELIGFLSDNQVNMAMWQDVK